MNRRAALALIALLPSACRTSFSRSASERVVSISPSTTEALFAIGAAGVVVGRSRYCDYPPQVKTLPAVGGFSDPNVEAILALRPSLVVGARGPAGPRLEDTLRAHAIDTFFPSTESLAEIESMITELGKRLGHQTEAEAVVATIEDQRRRVALAVRSRPPARVALVFDVGPIFVAGPGGFPDELIRLAGGTNVITTGGAYPSIELERLLVLAPDVILDGASDAEDGKSRVLALKDAPGWRDLEAMKRGRVHLASMSSLLRPGPRIGEGLIALAKAIHGDELTLPP